AGFSEDASVDDSTFVSDFGGPEVRTRFGIEMVTPPIFICARTECVGMNKIAATRLTTLLFTFLVLIVFMLVSFPVIVIEAFMTRDRDTIPCRSIKTIRQIYF